MPGLRLTERQVERLCHVSASSSASALRALVSAGYLHEFEDGSYGRADIAARSPGPLGPVTAEPPWRRILGLVEFKDGSYDSLTQASHSALRYATSLGVMNRARVTALHLVPTVPETAEEQEPFFEQVAEKVRERVLSSPFRGLIDVHVAAGSSNDDLLRSAQDIRADLIVVGRGDGGAACLSRIREMLHQAPCHVLVVHPSGHAAVA